MTARNRWAVLLLLVGSILILIPGLVQPVLTIRGVLTREGVAAIAPQMLDKGVNDETVATLKSMMNPQILMMLEVTRTDLRKTIIDRLTPQLTKALQNSGDVEVYTQTRSIIGSIRNLYDVGSPLPATLILLFSVIVPFTKAALVAWAVLVANGERGRRTMRFVEAIAKWSMADVFVVALFIAYLAAEATQRSAAGTAPSLLAFEARFGAGFYWFAAYCVISLASQQYTRRVMEHAIAGNSVRAI